MFSPELKKQSIFDKTRELIPNILLTRNIQWRIFENYYITCVMVEHNVYDGTQCTVYDGTYVGTQCTVYGGSLTLINTVLLHFPFIHITT